MSINSGLFAGVAAVSAQSTAFAVISDNIANVNTVGFKDSTTQFQSLVTQSLSTATSAGGVKAITKTDPIKQGLLQGTTNSTDIALDGNGFFITNEAATPGIGDEYLLTRAGGFIKDENDKLVNTAGLFLQGYATDGTGAITNNSTRDLLSSLETVDLSKFQRVAAVTKNVEVNLNLNSNQLAANNPSVTNVTVYDSQGNDYLLELAWTKTAVANVWTCVPQLKDTAGGTPVADTGVVGNAIGFTVTFKPDGTPLSMLNTANVLEAGNVAGTKASTTLNFTAARITAAYAATTPRAVDDLQLELDIGNYETSAGVTQYDAPYQTSLLKQDGNGPTDLERVSFSDQGILTAIFADGSSRPVYRIPIGTVPAASELESLSGNAYRITAKSGEVVLNFATEGGAGRVSASALENSTVDIASQFTDLIIAQRAYSAATKIITTGDELLEEITRVKR
jgi:flagellar hook protein FlgE